MTASYFAPHQVKHLLLLVGENPLPNYVAVRCLLETGGTPHLIHTTETEREAHLLKEVLYEEIGTTGFQPAQLKSLDKYESDAYRIQREIRGLLEDLPSGRIGLNYTGGTKPMAVHAYHSVYSTSVRDVEPVFSYLDPRQLELCIDRAQGERTHLPVRRENLSVRLETIFRLHGKQWKVGNEPRQDPIYADLACALANVMSEKTTATAWLNWFHQSFCNEYPNADEIIIGPAARKPNEKRSKQGKWKSKTELEALNFPLSEMPKSVREHLPNNLLIEDGQLLSMQAVKDDKKFKDLRNFCRWLEGVWLEHYVLQQICTIAEAVGIADYGMNFNVPLEGTKNGFEFDVAFTCGYQLFAISCTTGTDADGERGLCKLKLLEAYVRAQQMGGQEARVALVCCADDPDSLRAELAESISNRQIRVFGRQHLPDLADAVTTWIAENDAELPQ